MANEDIVYSISLKGSSHIYALLHLHADQFHGVYCLKGIAHSAKGSPGVQGQHTYIPVAEIAAITEYESWADFEKTLKPVSDAPPSPPVKKKAKKKSKPKKRR